MSGESNSNLGRLKADFIGQLNSFRRWFSFKRKNTRILVNHIMKFMHFVLVIWSSVSESTPFDILYSRFIRREERSWGGSRGKVKGVPPPRYDLRFSNTTGILQKKLCFKGVEVEQETSAPPPKKILDPSLRSRRSEFNYCDRIQRITWTRFIEFDSAGTGP